MPVIVVSTPKGGAGKSTTCLVLGTILANEGATVTILDTDPQRTLYKWALAGKSRYADLVKYVDDPKTLVDMIDKEAAEKQFVIIDVQGRATVTIARAATRADLILIPTQAKSADAEEAAEAVSLIRDEEKALRRNIPHRFVYTRTNAGVPTREQRQIESDMRQAGVALLSNHLNERTAFSQMIGYKVALDELDPNEVNGISQAKANASKFVGEVLEILTGGKND
ncbi:ParA family protein [Neorhizobium sp. T786]|uniref:ParA family protein n=1 Tax=Pseudorhizobium xiangyangii TaxID=2883104 RepID=UPI001CFFEE4C|nr:ParA family protein [Neorhizobium xiangyangii]MCB5205153.1 ParA family protein [Neorhizobium xiangyangii]